MRLQSAGPVPLPPPTTLLMGGRGISHCTPHQELPDEYSPDFQVVTANTACGCTVSSVEHSQGLLRATHE
jgi:hypothetical protein